MSFVTVLIRYLCWMLMVVPDGVAASPSSGDHEYAYIVKSISICSVNMLANRTTWERSVFSCDRISAFPAALCSAAGLQLRLSAVCC